MRKSLKVILIGIPVAVIILVCIVLWWLHGSTYVIGLTEAQIQAAIDKKFPVLVKRIRFTPPPQSPG
jgi:hypothetical protein